MKKIKITLVKSPIDRPERQKQTLKALGLNKANAAKEVEATPQILGMVRKVEHLVKVEECITLGKLKLEFEDDLKFQFLKLSKF